ncbi:hypothetical protein SFRURICE_003509 [Spodoptera frugiperda]|uniref:SFRICE_039764 n=1 Tax=Spodoptera frugiperda TaxID=7108 RepID=A0A2H1WGR7_SPOFR|nr:hypothetical protein SFRURICE_003509 [Spodoptera frugiperda]
MSRITKPKFKRDFDQVRFCHIMSKAKAMARDVGNIEDKPELYIKKLDEILTLCEPVERLYIILRMKQEMFKSGIISYNHNDAVAVKLNEIVTRKLRSSLDTDSDKTDSALVQKYSIQL